jgi:hypothetical protein
VEEGQVGQGSDGGLEVADIGPEDQPIISEKSEDEDPNGIGPFVVRHYIIGSGK